MDELESHIDRLLRETDRLATLVRTSADAEFQIVATQLADGVKIEARRNRLGRSLMDELRISAVPGFLPFSGEGLVLGDRILSFGAIEEYLQRLFRYAHRIETTRLVYSRPATVSIQGLTFFAGAYRFSSNAQGDRSVEIDDIYHSHDGHALKTATLAGCLTEVFRGFPDSLALFPGA